MLAFYTLYKGNVFLGKNAREHDVVRTVTVMPWMLREPMDIS